MVGEGWKIDFDVELLVPDGAVEGGVQMSGQDAVVGGVDAVEVVVVLGGDTELVADVVVDPVVEEE